MCGVFGVAGVGNLQGLEECALTLTHRGPDAFGDYHDAINRVYLAHCRLSIIDTSEAGNQPISDDKGNIWVTYNGEIYNFKQIRKELIAAGFAFRSTSDSEVIVHAYAHWGIECVKRFNGMFAFGLLDRTAKKIYLVRDRLGIKPLYYVHNNTSLAFASEPKALIGLPFYRKVIDSSALQDFLIYRYSAGENSIWRGIRKVKPGHICTFDLVNSDFQQVQYWKLQVSNSGLSIRDSVDRFESLLSSSMSGQMISDVPLGVFLSGGLDSSSVAAMAALHNPSVQTYSIGFPSPYTNETDIAQKTALKIGLKSNCAILGEADVGEAMGLFDYLDEPLGNSALFPMFLLSKYAGKHVKVAISGDGGDELFGGYRWYVLTEQVRFLKRIAFAFGNLLSPSAEKLHTGFKRLDKCQHYLLMNSPGFNLDEIKELFPSLRSEFRINDEAHQYRQHLTTNFGKYKKWQYVDAHTIMPDDNLVYVDRMSMANSLEVRVPLLDHNIVEFAFSLSDSHSIKGSNQKLILRNFLEGRGLGHLLDVSKQGFSSPINMFFPVENMLEMLNESRLVNDGLMSSKALSKHIAFNNSYKIWLMTVLEIWYRKWIH